MYPEKLFETLDKAREWVLAFMNWYNFEHRYSALNFVTPNEKHQGLDHPILTNRSRVYEAHKAKNPQRWSGRTRNWQPSGATTLNPSSSNPEKKSA